MAINSYRDLQAWQLGMTLAEEVYSLTRGFPREELFGLTSQLRRAAIGIPSHVAEGQRLKLAPAEEINKVKDRAAEVGRVLHGLSRSLARTTPRG